MRHSEGQTRTSDGLTLYTQTWLPDGEPKAMLAFSHGQAEHTGRYTYLGAKLAASGYGLHMADLRGHGRSPGQRGHIMQWEDYRRDFAAICQSAREVAPGVKYFFGGHSMGGLIALEIAVSNPEGYQGVAVSAPFLGLAFAPPAWKVSLGKLLSGLMPGLSMSNELNASGLSHDQAIVDAYVNDPMVHGRVTARFFTELVAAQAHTLSRAGDLRLPLLIMQGMADPIVDPSLSRRFYETAGSTDKTFRGYEGLYHEIFNEPEKDSVLTDLVAWLDAHL